MIKRFLYMISALLLIAVVVVFIAQTMFHAFDRSLTCHTWKSISVPLANTQSKFSSVALLSANDVWLAGSTLVPKSNSSTVSKPLVEHWDGQHWQTLFAPDPGVWGSTFESIAVISDSNVRAVGNSVTSDYSSSSLAEHWDGHSWHVMPEISSFYSDLSSVIALTSDNIWAVGTIQPRGDFSQTFIEHWDGSTWKRISSSGVTDENNQLNGVSAISTNDIWAVGTSKGIMGSALTLTEHWDGSHWNIVPSPDPSRTGNGLLSVAAISSNDVWAVGVMIPPLLSQTSAGGHKLAHDRIIINTDALIEHWDGQSWRVVSFPKMGLHQVLSSVTAYSSQDIWAAGFFVTEGQSGQVFHALLEHWDGSSRHIVQNAYAQRLNSISTSLAGGLWSAGIALSQPGLAGEVPIVETCV